MKERFLQLQGNSGRVNLARLIMQSIWRLVDPGRGILNPKAPAEGI
jgi:hypothetical protein